jgi:hypothetical protein
MACRIGGTTIRLDFDDPPGHHSVALGAHQHPAQQGSRYGSHLPLVEAARQRRSPAAA